MRNELPHQLDPARVRVVVDNREQTPWDLTPLTAVRGTLQAGDYAVKGAEDRCRIERKSLQDFVTCCGAERDRFERELERLLAYPSRIVIVEATFADVQAGKWRSQLQAKSAIGSIAAWQGMGISFLFAGDRDSAQAIAAKILYSVARRQFLACRELIGAMVPEQQPEVAAV